MGTTANEYQRLQRIREVAAELRDAWPRCFMCRKPGHGVSDGEADWPVRVSCKEHSMHNDAIDVFPGADEAAALFALLTDAE